MSQYGDRKGEDWRDLMQEPQEVPEDFEDDDDLDDDDLDELLDEDEDPDPDMTEADRAEHQRKEDQLTGDL